MTLNTFLGSTPLLVTSGCISIFATNSNTQVHVTLWCREKWLSYTGECESRRDLGFIPSLPGGSVHRHRKATYDLLFKRCREPVAPIERPLLISVWQLLLWEEEFWIYTVMLAWRPVLIELNTYCKSRLCIRHTEDGGQSHISGYTGKKEVIWKLLWIYQV